MKRKQSVGFNTHCLDTFSLTHPRDREIALQTVSRVFICSSRHPGIGRLKNKKQKERQNFNFIPSHFQLNSYLMGLLALPAVTMAAIY